MVMFPVVIALHVFLIDKSACDKIVHQGIAVARGSAVKLDAVFRKRILCASTHATANQSFYAAFLEKSNQRAVALAFGSNDLAFHHLAAFNRVNFEGFRLGMMLS